MILKDLEKEKWCNCKRNKGHSAGTLLDGTDLIICNECEGICYINGKNKVAYKKEENV